MSGSHCSCNQRESSMSFISQYLSYHADMTNWLQQIHQNIGEHPNSHHSAEGHFHTGNLLNCMPHQPSSCVPHACRSTCMPHQPSSYVPHAHRYDCQTESSYSIAKDIEELESCLEEELESCLDEEYEDYENSDDSDDEYEFNVDAIIAMRQAKEELLSKDDSDSFELVENDREDFEHISENSSIVEPTHFKRPAAQRGTKNARETLKFLYGKKFSTIAGLETAMNLNFDRYCDMHQPTVWPVLPLRL